MLMKCKLGSKPSAGGIPGFSELICRSLGSLKNGGRQNLMADFPYIWEYFREPDVFYQTMSKEKLRLAAWNNL